MSSRAIRIAGASGSASDRRYAMASFAAAHPSDPIDVIISDYMSEVTGRTRIRLLEANCKIGEHDHRGRPQSRLLRANC